MAPDRSDGGCSAAHPLHNSLPVMVAPTTGNEFNVLRAPLAPVACWSLYTSRFDFDSSFVMPGARQEFSMLRRCRAAHQGSGITLFGHADPVGNDDYNKSLSGRRATAVYAVLIRDPDLWEELYSNPLGGDKWGSRQVQIMLEALAFLDPEASGPESSKDAIKSFQEAHGLEVDGIAGPNTRKELFRAYMDWLCTDELSGEVMKLELTDFLANGMGGGKGDYQGCGEFNPVMVFSKEEDKEYKNPALKAERDKENVINRRVVAYLFRKALRIAPDGWPCPRVKEGTGNCKKRFWSDAEKRRAPTDTRRHFDTDGKTMACCFYHHLAFESPCERGQRSDLRFLSVRILDDEYNPMGGRAYQIEVAGAEPICNQTAPDGLVDEWVPIAATEAKLTVWLSEVPENVVVWNIDLRPAMSPIETPKGIQERLTNLGYQPGDIDGVLGPSTRSAIAFFQKDNNLPPTGDPDHVTQQTLVTRHGC